MLFEFLCNLPTEGGRRAVRHRKCRLNACESARKMKSCPTFVRQLLRDSFFFSFLNLILYKGDQVGDGI